MPKYRAKVTVEQELEVEITARSTDEAETAVRDGAYSEAYCNLSIVQEIKEIREIGR